MTVTIERIEPAGPDRRAQRLVFSDMEQTRMTASAVIKESGLVEGTAIEFADIEDLLRDIELRLAKDRALRLLGVRERSRQELDSRLEKDGYPIEARTQVLDRLEAVGLIDDVRFASEWARSRASSGYGTRRIDSELAQKGISRDIAQEAIAQVLETSELERAKAHLRGRTWSSRKERDRLIRRLVARGFTLAVAVSAVDTSFESVDGSD